MVKDTIPAPILVGEKARTKALFAKVRINELENEATDRVPKSKVWDDDYDYVEEYAVMGDRKSVV